MKLKLVLILCITSNLSANVLFSQNAKLEVKFENKSIVAVLEELRTKTGYEFLYVKDVIPADKKVTASLSEATLEQILDVVLLPNRLSYRIEDNLVIITSSRQQPPPVQVAQPQSHFQIRGRVTDTAGEPLAGATVRIKTMQKGVITDESGYYTLGFTPSEKIVFVFSYIGMATEEIIFNYQEVVNVTMKENKEAIGDVYVTGYQTLPKERATGSFGSVSRDELAKYTNFSLADALEGKVAGVVKNGNEYVIRGRSSFDETSMSGAKNRPLYVVNGYPVEGKTTNVYSNSSGGYVSDNAPNINPEDIESITILKDAAAASIYGARAANGVIVITLRQGVKGQARINFSADMQVTPHYSLSKKNYYMSASDYIDMQYDWVNGNPNIQNAATAASTIANLRNRNHISPTLDLMLKVHEGQISQADADRQIEAYRSNGVPLADDLDEYIYQPVVNQRYYLSVSKATDDMNIMSTVTYTRNQGDHINTKSNELEVNLRSNFNILKWLKLEINAGLNSGRDKYPSSAREFRNFSSTSNAYPYTRLVDADGNAISLPFRENVAIQRIYEANKGELLPMDLILQDEFNRDITVSKLLRTRVSATIYAKITDWLTFNSGYQYEYGSYDSSTLYDKEGYAMRKQYNEFSYKDSSGDMVRRIPYGDSYAQSGVYTYNYTWRNQLSFSHTTNDMLHTVTAIAGTETREIKATGNNSRVWGYDPQTLTFPTQNISDWLNDYSSIFGYAILSSNDILRYTESKNSFFSFYTNASYSFMNRYDISGSIRWDMSNLFGTNPKYQRKPMWSLGLGWNISSEEFMQDLTWINRLKLRATYGINGNVDNSVSPYLLARYKENYYTGNQLADVSTPPNASLRWERTEVFNTGIDFNLFDNKLRGSIDYYRRNTNDILTNTNIDPTYGFTDQMLNVGAMTNNGIEVTLNGSIIRKNNWNWTAGATFAYNKNKITEYFQIPSTAQTLISYGGRLKGNPYNSLYAYRFARIDENGDPVVYDENGDEVTFASITNPDAVIYKGSKDPLYTGGFHTSVSFRGLELSMNFVYYTGHVKLRNVAPIHISNATGPGVFMTQGYDNAWKQAGDENKKGVTPRTTYSYDSNTSNRNSYWSLSDTQVVSAGTLSLRNVALTYNLPAELLRGTFFQRVSIRAQADNVFNLAAGNNPNKSGAWDMLVRPTYTFGVNLSF